MGQDPGSYPKSFMLRKNTLFNGRTEVINGTFTFSFIVPKDIAYQYGFGKISYYADDGGDNDASGFMIILLSAATILLPRWITKDRKLSYT